MATATAHVPVSTATPATSYAPSSQPLPGDDILLPSRQADAWASDLADRDSEFASSRQQVLCYLVKLNRALDQGVHDLAATILIRFCSELNHYLSVGHEETFRLASPAAHQYVAIAATSRMVMQFTDRFAATPVTQSLDIGTVQVALEALALTLETRFELEDELQLGYCH